MKFFSARSHNGRRQKTNSECHYHHLVFLHTFSPTSLLISYITAPRRALLFILNLMKFTQIPRRGDTFLFFPSTGQALPFTDNYIISFSVPPFRPTFLSFSFTRSFVIASLRHSRIFTSRTDVFFFFFTYSA